MVPITKKPARYLGTSALPVRRKNAAWVSALPERLSLTANIKSRSKIHSKRARLMMRTPTTWIVTQLNNLIATNRISTRQEKN